MPPSVTQTETRLRSPKPAPSKKNLTTNTPVVENASDRAPCVLPSFTVKDVRRAIPAHCFERSYAKSFGYLVLDLIGVLVLFILSRYIDSAVDDKVFGRFGSLIRHGLWLLYWIFQGSIMTGLWVIGHECGHGGFSDSELVNDVTGLIIHSSLLVPYFSWKVSHRRHHSNTGNIDKDEVFVPRLLPEELAATHTHEHEFETLIGGIWTTVYRLARIFLMLTFGWPLYLLMNATSNVQYPTDRWVNHFWPASPIFTGKEQQQVLISDLMLVVMTIVLGYLGKTYTFSHLFWVYGIPYLITNMNLVLITFLQHSDAVLPHYRTSEWDWLRGALATVDRDFGIFNHFHHHIADTHVVHHLFSNMPHYNAEEATKAVIPLLGPYYRQDSTPIVKALWNSFGACDYVAADPSNSGILWYK